jgi:hypothetical protein
MAARFDGLESDAIVELDFAIVLKENPNHVFQYLNKCRFEGSQIKLCKIGQRAPPLNPQRHLLKASLDCPRSCSAQLQIFLTKTEWDGSSNPEQLGVPVTGAHSTTKF